MSVGKSSLSRVGKAEKSGAAPLMSVAPDMENSTPAEKAAPAKKAPTKKAPAKKAAPKAPRTTVIANPSPETVKAVVGERHPFGKDLPVHLL